jgi:hypothetical protein
MRFRIIIVLVAIGLISKGQEPMKANLQNSALDRWLNKEVLQSRILDNMENTGNWVPFTTGAITVVDSRITTKISESKNMVTEMSLTDKKSHGGNKSLLIKFP